MRTPHTAGRPPDVDVDLPGVDLEAVEPTSTDAQHLLRLLVALQERERRYLTDALHDGPMQEFTAVLLALSRARKALTGDVAEALATIETRVLHAMQSLQRPPSPFRSRHDPRTVIEMALAQRVRGPLAERLDLVVDVEDRPPSRADLPVILAVVQLLLLTAEPTGRVAHVAVTIRSDAGGVKLTMRATGSSDAADDAGRCRAARLHRLAGVVGAGIEWDPDGRGWQAAWSSIPLAPEAGA